MIKRTYECVDKSCDKTDRCVCKIGDTDREPIQCLLYIRVGIIQWKKIRAEFV